jgi:hypothetical protein
MLKWFDVKAVDAFADSVMAEVKRRMPPESLPMPDEKKSVRRLSRMTDVVSDQVRAFARANRLNVYKRARLANRVKWGLRELGYPDTFADAFAYELITLVTVSARA